MDPSLAELFDKLHRRFDAFEAKWSKRDAEADRRIVVLEDITETRAAHEQRTEDLRVGAPKPIEERDETPILSDNWGGKFEEPVHIAEERDDEPVASDAASPPPVMEHLTLDVAATEEVEPEVCPLQIQELEKPSPRTPASEKVVSVASTTEVVFVGFASTAQIQEREKGGKVLKSVVSMLDRDSLAQGFLSVPHLPWRAPLLRRLWRLPPRRPRPRRRRRAPLRPPRLRRPRRAPPRPPWRCRPCSSRLRGPRPAPPRRRPWRARPRSPGRRRLWGIPLRRRPRRALLRPRRAPPRRRGRPPRLLARVRGRRPRLRAGTRATERGAVLRRGRIAPCSTSAVHRANPCLSERVSALLLLNDGCRECPISSFLSVRVGVRSLVASDAHVVIVTGEKPCVHDCCIDVSDSVHGAAVAQFTGSHSAQLASSDSLDANFATPKPDYSVFCLSVSPSNTEDYMPTNCSTDAPKLIDSGSGASIVVAMASSPTAVGTQVFNRMPGRYIIILNLAFSVDVVPTCPASGSYIVQKVLVRQLVENQVLLATCRDRALLRPLHWPSYSSYAAFVQLKSLPVVPHGMGSLFCWPEFTHFRLCHLWLPVPNSADGVLVTAAASSKCEPCAIWQLDSASSKCEPCAIWQLDSVQSEFRTNFEIAELHSVIGNSSGVFAVKSTWRGSLLGLMAMQLSCGDSESYFQWDAVREAMNKLIFKRVLIALLMYNICSYIWEVNSHTRELVTALPVLSRGKGFKFRMLNEDKSHDAVLLVFANKQDLPHSLKVAEITDKLGLYSLHQLHWYIENTCAPAVHFYGLAIEDDPPDVAQDVPTLQMQEL